jgi:hypothetical protein
MFWTNLPPSLQLPTGADVLPLGSLAGIPDPAASRAVRVGGGGSMHLGPEPIQLDRPAFQRQGRPWYAKILSFCFIIFCFEIGVFLLVFPWLNIWEANMVATYSEWLQDVWGNPYFKGALSGLGLVNIYISLLEIVRLIRRSIDPPLQ